MQSTCEVKDKIRIDLKKSRATNKAMLYQMYMRYLKRLKVLGK